MAVAENTATGAVQPAAIKPWRSPVAVGIMVSLLFKLIAGFFPAKAGTLIGQEEAVTQALLLVISGFGDLWALIARWRSPLQPLAVNPQAINRAAAIMLAVFLAGCATTQRSVVVSTPTGTQTVSTTVDASIAEVSQEVASYCAWIQAGLQVGGSLVQSGGKVAVLMRKAQSVFDRFCLAPPTNVRTALAALSDIYETLFRAESAVLRSIPVQVDRMSLDEARRRVKR